MTSLLRDVEFFGTPHFLFVVTIICNGIVFTNIKAVFLDKDGTLANVSSYLTRLGQLQARLMEEQVPGTYSLALKALGIASDGLSPTGLMAVGSRQETIIGVATAAVIQGCSWGESLALATNTFAIADRQCFPKALYTPLLPGALEFLKQLRQAGLKVSLVSADSQSNLSAFTEQYQLQDYFDHLQGTSQDHPSKIAPSFLETACDAVNVAPYEGLVIGDATTDLQIAGRTGSFIGFLGGWQRPLMRDDIASEQMLNKPSIKTGFATEFTQIQIQPNG